MELKEFAKYGLSALYIIMWCAFQINITKEFINGSSSNNIVIAAILFVVSLLVLLYGLINIAKDKE